MKYDLIIIGAGPAGYVAAIRAGQTGLKTALIEKEKPGGMCLNWGCIPTKALLESARRFDALQSADEFGIEGINSTSITFSWEKAVKRAFGISRKLTRGVEFLLKKNGVELIQGEATLLSENEVGVNNRLLETQNIFIATGSVPSIHEIPEADGNVVSIKELFELKSIPKNIVIYGSGSWSLELAQLFRKLNKQVTFVVTTQTILGETSDFMETYAQKILKKMGISVFFEEIKNYHNGSIEVGGTKISCDLLIQSGQRKSVLPKANFELRLNNGFLEVNEYFQTEKSNIFGIGDVNGLSLLAHSASAQGLAAVNFLRGIRKTVSLSNHPLNIYSIPEMARIGQTEEALKQRGIDFKISEFPLSANGKALTEGYSEGMVRILSEKKFGEVLGVEIIANHATDMIAEAALLMEMEGTVYDLATVIHAHPTISEVMMESAFQAIGEPIHT